MDLLSYQRTVFAFHGCDRRLRDAVLTGKKKLNFSLNFPTPAIRPSGLSTADIARLDKVAAHLAEVVLPMKRHSH
ncbi:MAG: hypothetical protein ACOYMN_07715 [Roseimicrobium sp.]